MLIPPTFRRSFSRNMRYTSRSATVATTSSISTVLARTDIIYARSLLRTTHLKGDLGEFFAGRTFIDQALGQKFRGNWVSLTPRAGRQGLDHLYMRIDQHGRFHWMVGESKYSTSQLGNTINEGQQMSPLWIRNRLARLGLEYKEIANSNNIDIKPSPSITSAKGFKQFEVIIDGEKYSFWRDSSDPDGRWHFSGSSKKLSEAKKMALKMGNNLTSPACHVRSGFIFRITPEGNDLVITIGRVTTDGTANNVSHIGKNLRIVMSGILNKNITDQELKEQIATAIQKKLPHLSNKDVMELADDLSKKYKNGELLKDPRPVWQSIAYQSLVSAAIAGTIDIVIQLAATKRVSAGKSFIAASSAGLGTVSGQVVNILLLKTQLGNQVIHSVSGLLHIGSSMTRVASSGLAGGFVSSILMAYGGLALGYYDLKHANRMAVTGTAGSVAGTAIALGVPALVGQLATAGTGTAIASLHGAAATNATMAWLGFGSLGAGGLGTAGGAVLLGGYVVVAAIAVSAVVSFGYTLYDESEQRKFSLEMGNRLNENGTWQFIASKRFQYN